MPRIRGSNKTLDIIIMQVGDTILYSIDDVASIAKKMIAACDCIQILTLSGQVGAGKTTLAKEIIHLLTKTPLDTISSPTYCYLNTYQLHDKTVQHLDLYRIADLDTFTSLGLSEEIQNSTLSIIEWPEILAPILEEKNTLNISLHHESFTHRSLHCTSVVGAYAF